MPGRPLKIGVYLPVLEGRGSGHPADFTRRWPDLLAMARRAEDLRFDSLWLPDHLLLRWPGEERAQGIWECWSLLAALAAATTRANAEPEHGSGARGAGADVGAGRSRLTVHPGGARITGSSRLSLT